MGSGVGTAGASSRETENAMRYRSIIDAVRLINRNKQQVHRDEDLGLLLSPAWRLLDNAAGHLLKEAHTLLRGEDEK
jgi:hypothetical protein